MVEARGYAFPEFLADTEWLAERLHDGAVRIVDTDVAAAYQRGHVPGAELVPDNYEKDPDSGRVHILPPRKFAEMMESLGIGDDTMVVVYDNSRSLYAGRAVVGAALLWPPQRQGAQRRLEEVDRRGKTHQHRRGRDQPRCAIHTEGRCVADSHHGGTEGRLRQAGSRGLGCQEPG